MSKVYSYPPSKINVLLLEGIHHDAVKAFRDHGYNVEHHDNSMSQDELKNKLAKTHILGIRSKTQVKELDFPTTLLALGCFCIGTNQVDLPLLRGRGIPVFNSPFSNTRSVAELTLASIVMLARKVMDRSREMHAGEWFKDATNCYEVRGKTVGIIGYGKIGSQVSVLAEAFGLKVIYYDVLSTLPLGNASPVTLAELLEKSHFITLHVPETAETKGMFGANELRQMREGAYLLNLARGSVVDIDAVAEALKAQRLGGYAVDVFPEEPKPKKSEFKSVLQGLPNVIMTPHIGGNTLEAQASIGREVSAYLLNFLERGSTNYSVNFPQVDLQEVVGCHRLLNCHRNEPGVLSKINNLIAEHGANVERQYLGTMAELGYLIIDMDKEVSKPLKEAMDKLDDSIHTRLLY